MRQYDRIQRGRLDRKRVPVPPPKFAQPLIHNSINQYATGVIAEKELAPGDCSGSTGNLRVGAMDDHHHDDPVLHKVDAPGQDTRPRLRAGASQVVTYGSGHTSAQGFRLKA